MAMSVARPLNSEHKDLIHDVAFDYHGRRMATCSSDQTVKVWDLGEDGQWHCTANWKTHSGSVWRVTWANPEFGQVLATCSFDRTAGVWEEMVGLPVKEGGQSTSSHWLKKTNLVDSRTSVTDVKFAPKHLGLQLATCSVDGIVRIYEAVDVMTLSNWPLQHEINCRLSCSCLSWNPSRLHPPMLAVGSDDSSSPSTPKVQVYEYNEAQRKWLKVENLALATEQVHDVAFAPNLGRSHHLLAIAARDLKIISLKPLSNAPATPSQPGLTKFEMRQVAEFNDHDSQVWRVSWNVTGTVLASSGDDGVVRLWKANYLGSWRCVGALHGGGNQPPEAFTLQPLQNHQQGSAVAPSNTSGVRVAAMNIKRNSGWPYLTTHADQGNLYY